jgi:transcription elongation factor GreA-like protein
MIFSSTFRKKPMGYTHLLYFSLGDFVIHPDQPNWGIGQVQSIVGMNVTVNFEHAGKQMINCNIIALNAAPRPTK